MNNICRKDQKGPKRPKKPQKAQKGPKGPKRPVQANKCCRRLPKIILESSEARKPNKSK
jgi:hypothetical protein